MGEKKRKAKAAAQAAAAAGAAGLDRKYSPKGEASSAVLDEHPAAGTPSAGSASGTGVERSGRSSDAAEGALVEPKDLPQGEAAAPEEAPLSAAPLPLLRLEADWLGGFFELCFADKRLLELCRELKIITPGFRLESLPPEQVARVLADEYLAAEDVRAPLEQAVREALRGPIFEGHTLPPAEANEALEQVIDAMVAGDPLQHLARIAWAALLVEPPAAASRSAIDEGLRALEAPQRPAKKQLSHDEKSAQAAVQKAERAAAEAKRQAERSERERESLQKQLAASRLETSECESKLGSERAELSRLRIEHAQLRAELSRLQAAGEGRALADLRRAEAESRGLSERLARGDEQRAQLEARLAALEKQLAQHQNAPASPAAADNADDLPSEDEAATFLLPVFTREFYDSIERWSRRMQRAAFDKIHRLAEDWRHGSLRALALEGLPGYYRIRVATDVRLIYRREGNQLEILSLIDREDLDRYIRQARTR